MSFYVLIIIDSFKKNVFNLIGKIYEDKEEQSYRLNYWCIVQVIRGWFSWRYGSSKVI